MRSIWKGTISFGLVSIPVQLFSATQEHRVPLHQVHARDGSRIRMHRFCEKEGKEVPYEEIARGYQSPDGRTVVLDDQDLADLPLPSKKLIDVLAFVDSSEIDPVALSSSYYVGADRAGAKPYVLLREALREAGQLAVTKVTLRTRESLAVLRARQDVLVLQTMLWPDEIRPAEDAAPEGDTSVRPQELKMARSLMDTLSEGFDLGELHDEYQDALRQVVEARLHGVELPHEEAARPEEGEVIDLMAALRGSVKAARGRARAAGAQEEPEEEQRLAAGGGGTGGGRRTAKQAAGGKPAGGAGAGQAAGKSAGEGRKTAGRAAAKKTQAKKTAAKKTAGKGTTSGRSASGKAEGDKGKKPAPRRRAS
ncbi:DNA repair protein [Wenjunlia vitaminophila]|uniref:Non-homologous end joining protein Ku n=1 Tax=Wenjunlia vitaminophila TaxID=76728 RepID=A0A0T6LVE7_WENVI|nr:Ku protein [Wenjunlia vitaminophila]KRV49976.1 DNA repair protein [Wenjunlia vitaminophila]